jgi:putative ABC transport system permease protein
LTAVATLALGIAVDATMFSLVSAFLLPRLPGREPQKVVVLSSVNPNTSFLPDAYQVSPPNYLEWRADRGVFADMAAADEGRTGSLSGLTTRSSDAAGQAEAIQYAAVSPNYFGIFGVTPEVGRTFTAGEDLAGRNHVAILSYGLWKRRFGGDPAVVGRTVRLNREDYTVVGVMGGDFRLFGFMPQLWTPLTLNASDAEPAARKSRWLILFARLTPGVTLAQARAEMTRLAQRAQQDFPDTEKRWGAAVRTLPDYLVYEFGIRNALTVIMTMVSFVLLIACANVAGLLLARGAGRQKELAIRASLGASRMRVMRQLLTEGLAIGLAGGGAGLALTILGVRVLRASLRFNEAISSISLHLDWHVVVFALGISLVAAVLSSVVPALKASHTDIEAGLKSESRTSSAGQARSRLRAVLVGGEIAMALFLLIGSGLLIRGIYLLEHQKLGFRQDHLLTAGVLLDHAQYSDAARQTVFVREVVRRLEGIPGVEVAAVASDLPAAGGNSVAVRLDGEPVLPATEQRSALDAQVTPGYFRAAGIPLLRGRMLTAADDDKAPSVVLVNEEFVRRYFQNRDALGKEIELDDQGGRPVRSQIVGVVSNVRYYSEETRFDPEVYQAFAQKPVASFSLMLRASVDPNSLIPALRHAVSEQDPELPLLRVMSMDGVIEVQRNGDPVFSRMLAIFALLALILAAIGVYGLIAYSVVQRTHEIGIRMALGAKESAILWMILREGLKIAAIGSAIGLAMALPLPRLLDSMFEGFHFGAPEVYAMVAVAMLIVVVAATYAPARRAARVDPTRALRSE